MKKRIFTLALAIIMIFETMMPVAGFAKEITPEQKNLVKVGTIDINSYPQPDAKIVQEVIRRKRQELKKLNGSKMNRGAQLFSSPYFPGQDPDNDKKPLIYANVTAVFETKGLDGGGFNWEGVFGKDSDGNVNKAQIVFEQIDNDTSTRTGVKFFLKVDKTGEYTWSDDQGKPTKLPIYSKELKPYKYEVKLDEDVSNHVKLLTSRFFGTGGKYAFGQPDPATGEIVGNINLDLTLQQIASTKFTSKWNTSVEETNRPTVEGSFLPGNETDPENYGIFKFPSNDTDKTIIRNDKPDTQNPPEYSEYLARDLEKTPKVDVADPDPESTDTYTLDRDNNKISYKEKTYKYSVEYDVINGGKLTMTEVLPVTFDANGGKFVTITDPSADQKIVKEVDYGKDLTDKVEEPKKDLETFKGWATAKDGAPLSKEDFEKTIKNITEAKTFYAVWNNNETTAEELEVKESYNDGTKYVNDFIPTLDQLKGQVKIKKADGTLKPLAGADKFVIVDGNKEYTADGDDLKNYLYDKLQEKDNPKNEPTRVETVKAKVTFANNNSKTVDIPIKVIKNIYESKTESKAPYYVPADYVKVTVDPTTKAEKPQKTYYYVNPKAQVVIPGENPTGTNNYTFEKWTIGNEVYELAKKPRHNFTQDTTIEAQYVSNIIPAKADGSKPDNVPTDFVLVEFKSGSQGKLEGTTKYWVNPSAGIKLSDITHPTIKPNDGWKQNGWDKKDNTEIKGALEVTAQYLEKVVTKQPADEIKDKYVKVTFKQGDYGTIANTEQTQYWVLKQEEVNLIAPTVTPKTGYAQKTSDAAWSPKIAKYYYEDVEHVAQYKFNGTDVIPQTGEDKPTTVPDGYVLVTFDKGANGEFEANQTTKYWVNPNKEVTLPAPQIKPNTGYKQQDRLNAWDKPLTKTFTETTTITAQYEALDDILTEEKPGYVKVEFKAGDHGNLDGTKTYWVNPLKGKTLADITHPNVKANDGWSHNGWDKADTTAIDSNTLNPLVVTAKYLEKVLKTEPTENKDKYVTVEFTNGDHGEIKTGETAKYWVLKNTEVSLTAPGVTPATGYAQKSGDDAWSPKQATKYSANAEHVAQYYYNGDDVIAPNPDGSKPDTVPANFVQVTFESGENGTIDAGQTVKYWVNPNKEVTVNAPSLTANQGYEQKPGFNAWDKYLTATFKEATTIKAEYNKLDDILTVEKPGYVKVEFKTDTNGTLDGTTIYYVNPAANKKLSDIRHPNVTAKNDFKHVGWDVEESTVIDANKTVTAKYLKDVLTSDPHDTTNYVKVTFDKGAHGNITAGQAEYWVLKNTEVSITAPTVTADTAKGFKQKDGKDAWSPEVATAYSQDTTHVAQYTYMGGDVIPQTGNIKPDTVPDNFVKVTFVPTDKATETGDKIFWVAPYKRVTIDIKKPEGRAVGVGQDNGNTQAYKWNFTKWISKETKARTWDTNIDTSVTAVFDQETTIEAKYEKIITNQGKVLAEEILVHESFKDGDNWINNFIDSEAKEDLLKGAVKRTNASGKSEALPTDATVTLLNDQGKVFANDDALKAALYDKLQEKDDGNKPSRRETLKAKVKFQNGEEQTVDIPIKVIKNIYEATTKEGKPNYVPQDYVKVTVDPTTKATDPQKYFYYVNPKAQVVIPENNPVGTGDNKFVKWTYSDNGTETEYKLADKPRHMFKADTIITAQYVSDVIPQDGTTKPDYVPANYVEVKFVPTDKATDTAEKIFWVNPDKKVTIPVNNPVGKTYFTFKEWKIGDLTTGETYKVGKEKQFTDKNGTTITATYEEAKSIIPYDPSVPDPMVRPEGYVRITFVADSGLKLKEQKAFYVKKSANITLKTIKDDLTNYGYPTYEAQTGYKFEKWDKEDSLVIEAADIVVTAKPTKLETVIPEKDNNNNPNEKPTGYKEVTFVIKDDDKTKGSIDGVAKFYVNPKEYVTINPPATKANTGFEFGAWDKDATIPMVYKEDTTITGSFNGLKDIIPKTNPDGTENKKPDGYKTVTFVIDPATGGKIEDKQVTVYYVNPAKEVTVPQPKTVADTGYEFEKWDTDTTTAKKYDKDITVKGNFKKLEDIIPSTNDQGKLNAKPNGYVTVTFDKGEHGKEITGQAVYYVNPKANPTVKLGNEKITKPTVQAEVGYKFTGWDTKDDFEIKDNKTVIAQYESIDDVIPKNKPTGGENTKPEDYITVTFEKGANGELEGNTIFYINPNKAVVLEDKAPTVKPNTGYTSAGWDTSINKDIQYKDGDKITALYNELGDVIPQKNTDGSDKPAGYLTVTFDKGDHGTLSGKTVFYVKPNKEVTVSAPTVTPAVGYKFEKWDKALTQAFAEDTKITAEYKELGDIIPQEKTDGSDKPEGYHTVTFKPDDNGTLSGTTVYYVKPNVDIDLTNTAKAITKNPKVGYTADGGTWDKELKAKFNNGDVLTFTFKNLPDVIEIVNGKTRPVGYVRVDVIPTYFAKDMTIKSYWVNPNKKVTIPSMPIEPLNDNFKFLGWDQPFTQKFMYHTNIIAKFEIVSKPTPDYNGGGNIYIGGGNLYIGGTTEKIVEVPAKAKALRKAVRYMQGFNGYFRPNDGLTRAEAAQILANALREDGYNYNPNYQISYKDIGREWYTEAVRITTEANVFAGYDDGFFRPEKKITRAEWVATLRRFQNIAKADGNHMNLSENHWAKSEIEGAFNEGWLKIYLDGLAKFNADEFIPRQEVAAVSNRAFNRAFDKIYIDRNDNALINQYKDVKPSMWAYEDILCASNTYIHDEYVYRAHDVKNDKMTFNVDLGGLEIIQDKFQRILR